MTRKHAISIKDSWEFTSHLNMPEKTGDLDFSPNAAKAAKDAQTHPAKMARDNIFKNSATFDGTSYMDIRLVAN